MMMRRNALLAVASTSIILLAGANSDRQSGIPLDPEPGIYRSGQYRYEVRKIRSNRQSSLIGTLWIGDREVQGQSYFRLDLEVASFIYYGPGGDPELTGWRRIDPKRKYPRWIKAEIVPNDSPDAKILRTRPRPQLDDKPQEPPATPDKPAK